MIKRIYIIISLILIILFLVYFVFIFNYDTFLKRNIKEKFSNDNIYDEYNEYDDDYKNYNKDNINIKKIYQLLNPDNVDIMQSDNSTPLDVSLITNTTNISSEIDDNTIIRNNCAIKNQGKINAKLRKCKIYYTNDTESCDTNIELYKLSINQLKILYDLAFNSETQKILYNDIEYTYNNILKVINDKNTNNVNICKFEPKNLYEIDSIQDYDKTYKMSKNPKKYINGNFVNEDDEMFGCLLPLNGTDLDAYGNISSSIISFYGDNNKRCISDSDTKPIINVTCKGVNDGSDCPSTNNKYHQINDFTSFENDYILDIPENTIFMKIANDENNTVSYVEYNSTTKTLDNIITYNINIVDNLYTFNYINPRPLQITYPTFKVIGYNTLVNGINVRTGVSSTYLTKTEKTNVRKYPPNSLSAKEQSTIISGQPYGNGEYIINFSTQLWVNDWKILKLFNNVIEGEAGGHSGFNRYDRKSGNSIYPIKGLGNIIDETGEWIKIKLPVNIYLSYIKIFLRREIKSRSPRTYTIYGSNDDSNWIKLLTATDIQYNDENIHISNVLSETNSYNYFIIIINSIQPGNDGLFNFEEFELWGIENDNVSTDVSMPIYNIFDKDIYNVGWETYPEVMTTYIHGYPGEYFKCDLGMDIILEKFKFYPVTKIDNVSNSSKVNRRPKKFRIYGTNDITTYDNMGTITNIIITENGINKNPSIVNNSTDNYYEFKNTGINNYIKFPETTICEVFMIGGGGGGGFNHGGGGGAGAYILGNITFEANINYNIVVGRGGSGAINNVDAVNGGESVIIKNNRKIYTASGGGGGGIAPINIGKIGGCGGGGNGWDGNTKGTRLHKGGINNNIGIGFAGGDSYHSFEDRILSGGGGGGISGVGTSIIMEDYTNGLRYKTYRGTGARPEIPDFGELFNDEPLTSSIVNNIDFNWGGGPVFDSGLYDQVIINFYGYIKFPKTKKYSFHAFVDDGIYLKINDNVILNSWVEQGPAYFNTSSSLITFEKDIYYKFDLWYYENGGGAACRLFWNSQNATMEIVPPSVFFRKGTKTGGNGGPGKVINIKGIDEVYGGGGGGGAGGVDNWGVPGIGGGAILNGTFIKVGGDGANEKREGVLGGNAVINTGSGGGSAKAALGGKGADGVVIIRWTPKIQNSDVSKWNLLYTHTGISIPLLEDGYQVAINQPKNAIKSYRYYMLVVNSNYENSLGTAIAELEFKGYQHNHTEIVPQYITSIYLSPKVLNKEVYSFIFDNNKIKDFIINNINKFTLNNNFKNISSNNLIVDKSIRNVGNITDRENYSKICDIIGDSTNELLSLSIEEIDIKVNEYNTANRTGYKGLSYYKNEILSTINMNDMSFIYYDKYKGLFNNKFMTSNDDCIYIKLL